MSKNVKVESFLCNETSLETEISKVINEKWMEAMELFSCNILQTKGFAWRDFRVVLIFKWDK